MWRSGETDLVVHHDVHCAACFVTAKAGKGETFCHNTLACECRIAVKQDWHNAGAFAVVVLVLLCANLADDDGVYRLKVAWVGSQ